MCALEAIDILCRVFTVRGARLCVLKCLSFFNALAYFLELLKFESYNAVQSFRRRSTERLRPVWATGVWISHASGASSRITAARQSWKANGRRGYWKTFGSAGGGLHLLRQRVLQYMCRQVRHSFRGQDGLPVWFTLMLSLNAKISNSIWVSHIVKQNPI